MKSQQQKLPKKNGRDASPEGKAINHRGLFPDLEI